jgi:hypothetical protein
MKTACIDGLRTTPGTHGLINWLASPGGPSFLFLLQATSSKQQALDIKIIVG